MFKLPAKIFGHKSVLDKGNFVLPDYILNKNLDEVNLFHRFCPHRMYPLHQVGEHVNGIQCKFHNFQWTKEGHPINNQKKLHCGSAKIGRSGLIYKNFQEPEHSWVTDLSNENNLEYSHLFQGQSKGSWLWLMDVEADLLHLHKEGIHPFLSKQIKLEDIKMDQGSDWIYQEHPNGWWLYIYPYTFVEYGRPGCVMVNSIVPNDINIEYGFSWTSQFYYDPNVDVNRRMLFETLETVFEEDVKTSELQKGNYFPLMKAINKYEDHCVHWGQWITKNKINES